MERLEIIGPLDGTYGGFVMCRCGWSSEVQSMGSSKGVELELQAAWMDHDRPPRS
jgi:hypothetical protein